MTAAAVSLMRPRAARAQAGKLAGPAAAVASAAADLATLDPYEREHYRYLTDYNIPVNEQGNFNKVLSFTLNSISREADFERPTVVPGGLYRIDIRAYGWNRDVYERLKDAPEPYFHARVETKSLRNRQGRRFTSTPKFRVTAAPWLPADDISYLVLHTQSQVPILRADWFFAQVSIQEQRVAGYYDWLGVKNRADWEKLVGVSRKLAVDRKSEVRAIIPHSGVAQNNRQIERLGAVDGAVWGTLDVFDTETGKRNAIRNLDKDFVHQAEEHYGFLPNGLFAYLLCDADGTLQNTAPDKIGPDTTSTSNDKRIHPMLSCIRCHQEGLRPLDDYARRLYQPPVALGVPLDYDKFKRLKQLYLGELQRHLRKDNEAFAFAVRDLTGWPFKDISDAYRQWWQWIVDDNVTVERAAIELGVTPLAFRTMLAKHALPPDKGGVGAIDPVLAAFIHTPPLPVRREHWEEVYSKAAIIVMGGVQP